MAKRPAARPEAPRPRGRPPKLSREAIARAALQIGFAEVTLVSVAEALKVSHAALYSHVVDRADLARAALDVLYAEAPWPACRGPWRRYLEREAGVLWSLLERDPALVLASAAGGMSPGALAHFNAAARVLIDEGFAPEEALLAVDTVFDLVHDVFVRGQQLVASVTGEDADEAWLDALDRRLRAPTRRAVRNPRRWFERKLKIVLDGIAAGLAPATCDRDEGGAS
ncbi:TetR/AcrR family transcriptional regulator [Nannocystis radixulma]|uniref:Transcriptional regulator, TetR family n=1 Tax=Nannocystis radixulma TaxID=2995305 RepID=A0ABT5BH59_9BACT|nr:hypothetical protein [Nannocystis radixulma]MDC0673485.1 hypothetical protein [Nannocystis radixulma]